MKKIFLSCFLVLILSTKAFAGDYYFVGVDCFKKGVYGKAVINLEHAIRINSKNVNARYYLAQSYLMQRRISEAKDQYSRIMLLAPTSDAALLSEKGLSLIRQSELGVAKAPVSSGNSPMQFGDNYLDYVLTGDGKILKWASFPIVFNESLKKQMSEKVNSTCEKINFAISSNVFPKNKDRCIHCEYNKFCEIL